MKMQRWPVALFLLALLGVAGYLTLRWTLQKLRDGEEIALGKVTYGTFHSTHWESAWMRRLRPILPRAVQFRIPPPVRAKFATPTNAVIIWFHLTAPAGQGNTFNLGSKYECTLLDSEGNEVAVDSISLGAGTGFNGDRRRLCYATFPWVTGHFRLRVQQRVVNDNGTINFTKPRPPGAGMSGARLHPERAEFKLWL